MVDFKVIGVNLLFLDVISDISMVKCVEYILKTEEFLDLSLW